MSEAPLLVVRELDAGVRPVRLRLPFRFGAVTLAASPQLFVRARVELAGGRSAVGFAAEMMVPKWFDKRAERSPERNVADLVRSVERATDAYRDDDPATPFGLHARHYPALMADPGDGPTDLSKAYGQAVLDRAVLDATCRTLGVSFFDAAKHNLFGLSASPIVADLAGFDWDGWLRGLVPLRSIEARHTIGLLDELHAARVADDGLPASLPAAIARYGVRCFKIKLGGDAPADLARLREVLGVLERLVPDHRYTLDGNEQYADRAALAALFQGIAALPARARNALLYLEQPVSREHSLDSRLDLAAAPTPLLLDEADGTLDAFPQAAQVGWRGVSSKGCKGLYKSIVNRARCELWNRAAQRDGVEPGFFMSAEDLTCQAGLAVQQDLALAALLGLAHGERNGHHYGGGFGSAPATEAEAFRTAHPDLYERADAGPRLRIVGGRIDIGSLLAPGFAHGAEPDWTAMNPLHTAASAL